MPEETTPPGNSVETEAAQIDWDSPDNPYVQRYRDTQAEYTRGQQRLRELEAYENDPEKYIELGKQRGWVEVEEAAAAAEAAGVPPEFAQTQQELAELRAWKDQVETERQERAYAEGEQAVRTQHDEWAKEAGITLDDFDHDAIIKRALDSGANTIEDVKGIFDAYVERHQTRTEQLREQLAAERKRPRVPTAPVNGQTATGAPNWSEMTPEEIDQYMAEQVRGS